MSKLFKAARLASVLMLGHLAASVSFAEDCVSFNPATANVTNVQGRWKIADGNHLMFDFGGDKASADKSLAIIKYFGMNQSCFVGRPNPSFKYMLTSGRAPSGNMAGEDCLPFNPAHINLVNLNNDWKIVDGNRWLFSFGNKPAEAQQAFAVIKQKGFNQSCFVGRPNPAFSYLKMTATAPAPARKMTSCMKTLAISTQISNDYLHSAVNAQAHAANLNTVTVDIYGSNIINTNTVDCHYKSKNGDIPNLVYKYPCNDARKENTGYAHSYSCAQ